MSDVGLGHTESHRANEALELDGLAGESLADERGLVDHALPALVLVLSGLDDLEHLLLGNTADLGKGDRVLCGAVLPPVLDGGRERLCVLKPLERVYRVTHLLTLTVKKIGGESALLDGTVVLLLDVALVVGLELLLHLHLLGVTLSVVQLGLVADHLLRHLRVLVHLTRLALAPDISTRSPGLTHFFSS